MKRYLLPGLFIVGVFICSFAWYEGKRIDVVFIGDSITHGTMGPGESPPVYAGEFLRQQKGVDSVAIANQGVSGFTTVDFLPSVHKSYLKVRTAADAFYADKNAQLVFSFMLGTNDSAIKGPTGSPVAPANYRANLQTIADSLLAVYPNCKIVFNYPIWYSDNTHNRGAAYMKEGQQRVLEYWHQIDTLVKQYRATNPQHVYAGDKKAYNYFKKNYLTDLKAENGLDGVFYLHPNKKGDRALGVFWAKAILKATKD
jgi:lysophospholipase L1-like esterase